MAAITILGVLFYIHAIFLYLGDAQEFNEEDKASFKTLCSSKCRDLKDSDETLDFPLHKCSCSPSCATYGDCCYDSPYRSEKTRRSFKSICASIHGRGEYRVKAGCPADTFSDFCHEKIGHLPPVTSKKTNTSYANIFCANCNEDGDDAINWNVELKCSSDATDGAVSDSTVIIYQSNHLWRLSQSTRTKKICTFYVHYNNFSLIDGLELRTCDSESKVSYCSSSWRDTKIMKLCRSYEDPVYIGNQLFKNAHCAECNYMAPGSAQCMPSIIKVMLSKGLMNPSSIELCRNRRSKACMDYLSTVGKGVSYSFDKLLNIYEKPCIPEQGKLCCKDEEFDSVYSKSCIKVKACIPKKGERCCDGEEFDSEYSNACKKIRNG